MLRKKGDAEGPNTFYCKICEIGFNDSISYMDHKNGKKHNRVLGMNMKVKKVGVDAVNQTLELLAQKKKLKKEKDGKLSASIRIKKMLAQKKRKPPKYGSYKKDIHIIESKNTEKETKLNEAKADFLEVIKGNMKETRFAKEFVEKEDTATQIKEEPEEEGEEEDYVDHAELERYKALGIPMSFKSTKQKK